MTGHPSDPTLANRRALVTGGATGIGWSICRLLAAEGVRVALADINIAGAEDRVRTLGEGHVALQVNLSDLAAASALPGRAAETLGGLDIIVNNAGITDTSGRRIGEIAEAEFLRLVAINLGSVEAVCKAGQSVLGNGGVTVNLASGAAFRALPFRGAYSATKAGVVALTRKMNDEGAALGQRVSAVAPGYVRTELVESLISNGRLDPVAAASTIPLGRLGTTEDIARGIVFLASGAGAVMAGHCLGVDGGTGAAGGAKVLPQDENLPTVEGGPLVVLGSSAASAALAGELQRLTPTLHIRDLADLPALGAVAAILDAEGLEMTGTAAALLRARAVAGAVEAMAPVRGLPLVLTTRGEDTVATAAMDMMARLLAQEWAPRAARVTTIGWSGDSRDGLAALAAWLSSEAAGYVTGQLIQAKSPN